MASISSTDLANALKRYYGSETLNNVVFGSDDRPASNMLPKSGEFAGSVLDVPVLYEDSAGGRSATFSNAQTNASAVEIGRFAIDVVANHQVVQIDTDALLRGRNDRGTFLRNQILRVDTGINNLANDVEVGIFGSASGQKGTISATSATTITLSDAENARQFYVNQVLVAAADATSALRASPGTTTVTGVDYNTGILTVDTDPSAGDWAANDLLFTQGDYTAANDVKKLSGFETWLTGTSTLFGQARTAHSRLQGTAHAGSLADIKKAITDAAATAKAFAGAKPDLCFCSWDNFASLVDQLEADVQRTPGNSTSAGFTSITVFGPSGPIKIVGATHCTPDTMYLLQTDTWTIYSMGDLVRVNNDDGLMASRQASAAGLEVRIDSHANLACRAPAKNARITLS